MPRSAAPPCHLLPVRDPRDESARALVCLIAHHPFEHVCHSLKRTDEAVSHWLKALERGSYDYKLQVRAPRSSGGCGGSLYHGCCCTAYITRNANSPGCRALATPLLSHHGPSVARALAQAVQRLTAASREASLPPQGQLQLSLGDTLVATGRSREAAVRFAAAHLAAPKEDNGTLSSDGRTLREEVDERMLELAGRWDEGEGMPPEGPRAKRGKESGAQKAPFIPTVIEATADGRTTVQQLTPEKYEAMRGGRATA